MPKPMRATRRHASADDLVEVEIEAAADEAAALISERQACASGSEIVLDPLAAGTEAVVVAGHRPELVGVRVMILPSTDLTSRNGQAWPVSPDHQAALRASEYGR